MARSVRKNADGNLRKLERAAQSGDRSDIVSYWRACLQAGVPPDTTDALALVFAAAKEDEATGKSLVIHPNEKTTLVKNLGWLLRQQKLVRLIEILTPVPSPYDEAGLVVRFTDGTIYVTLWASSSMLWDWLDRPSLRGVPVVWYDITNGPWTEGKIQKGQGKRPNPRVKRRNADDLLRKLERKAFETEDRTDILAYWAASLRAGILPKPTYTSNIGSYVYVANIKDYLAKDRIKPEMPRIFVGQHIVLWDWESKRAGGFADTGVFQVTPENLFILLQELVDYETPQTEASTFSLYDQTSRLARANMSGAKLFVFGFGRMPACKHARQ